MADNWVTRAARMGGLQTIKGGAGMTPDALSSLMQAPEPPVYNGIGALGPAGTPPAPNPMQMAPDVRAEYLRARGLDAARDMGFVQRPRVVPRVMTDIGRVGQMAAPPQYTMNMAQMRAPMPLPPEVQAFGPSLRQVAPEVQAFGPSLKQAAPAAAGGVRGALGTAAKGVGLAAKGYFNYVAPVIGMAESFMDVTNPIVGAGKSELSEAGRPYREAFYRNVRDRHIPEAAGNFVMANAMPAMSYARRLVAPDTLWGNTNERQGVFPTMYGAERPGGRALREQNEAAIEASRQAFMQREAARSAQPVAAGAAMSEMGGVPLNVMEHYAKIYGAMAPRAQTTTDRIKANTMSMIMQRLKAEMDSTDPKVKAKAMDRFIDAAGALGTSREGYGMYQPALIEGR
jgi:hypothetical protein